MSGYDGSRANRAETALVQTKRGEATGGTPSERRPRDKLLREANVTAVAGSWIEAWVSHRREALRKCVELPSVVAPTRSACMSFQTNGETLQVSGRVQFNGVLHHMVTRRSVGCRALVCRPASTGAKLSNGLPEGRPWDSGPRRRASRAQERRVAPAVVHSAAGPASLGGSTPVGAATPGKAGGRKETRQRARRDLG